ncbi:MAG TPA: hypothetical protein VKA90_02275 [Beijerinckiaceae bacterium]|jgi:hypothetical protein|nr:hypothetical protein [Beijerinckiaceae bacterium]
MIRALARGDHAAFIDLTLQSLTDVEEPTDRISVHDTHSPAEMEWLSGR